jgi:hypothetical protein
MIQMSGYACLFIVQYSVCFSCVPFVPRSHVLPISYFLYSIYTHSFFDHLVSIMEM